MNQRIAAMLGLALTLVTAGVAVAATPAGPAKNAVSKVWHVGGAGGWDYATLNAAGTRLYLPRTTHTQVFDTKDGRVVADIPGNHRAHGVALVSGVGRGFITDGEQAVVQIFDLANNRLLGQVGAAKDADGILYDPASKRVLVMCGDSREMIAIRPDVDPRHGKADTAVPLGGSPESAAVDGKGRAFIDLVDQDRIAVVDTHTMKVIANWPTGAKTPVGLAIDPTGSTLFVGCRSEKMVVMSTKDGKVLADLPIGKGVDACSYANGTAYASCGDGTLTLVRETAPGKFAIAERVTTSPGARTLAVDAHTGTVYLPTARLRTVPGKRRPQPVPGTFEVLVVSPK
ncbi:MAG TPA: hypothetical protein V6D47_17575 [Oscillatoriaceae cyanobacterium]